LAKESVQTGLDTSKTVLTGTKDTVCSGVTGAMHVAKGTVQPGLDNSKTMLSGTKDTVGDGLTSAVNMATGAMQGGLATTTTMLTGTKDIASTMLSGTGALASDTIHTGLSTIQSWFPGTRGTIWGRASSDRATELCGEQTSPYPHACGLSPLLDGYETAVSTEETTGSALFRDELEGLGEIFHPMNADEQGERCQEGAGGAGLW
jgi:hypothetical protein